ncbi:putative hem peroxidase superfamily, hem peroxidase, animal-type [Helianthus anomalus]
MKGHRNIRTPWWDGSAVYGSNLKAGRHVRPFIDGKLKIAEDGLLQHDNDGLPIAGDVCNSWIGVSTLQALFIHEHNAVCDALKKKYPYLDDEDLYRHARLVTSAMIAKNYNNNLPYIIVIVIIM